VNPGAPRHLAIYVAARAVLAGLAFLPRRAVPAVGGFLGRLAYLLMPRRRAVARRNLERVFGAVLPAPERERIARAAFAHLGRICADAAWFPRLLRRPIDEVAVIEGLEHLKTAAADGKGVLVFSGHFGHWEIVPLVQPRLGLPFAMVVRPLNNPYLDRYLEGLRRRAGNTVVPKRAAARGVLRALRDGMAVAILIDQNVRGDAGLFVDFLGTPASTTPALATFALKTGAPIVPVFARPLPDRRVGIRYLPPIRAARRGALQDDILRLTRECTALLEAEIRRRPECWMWMHDRWRTRPPAARSGAAGDRRESARRAAHPPDPRAAGAPSSGPDAAVGAGIASGAGVGSGARAGAAAGVAAAAGTRRPDAGGRAR
jgi:KDO2-lipid IV(A) lauroyltransferase